VKVDYTMVGKLQHKIACDNLILDNTDYADDVTFYVCCLMDKTQKFIEDITDLTNGKAVCTVVENKYTDI
ncbi:MAG: DUF1949 domain-containing protein, partial [Clostridia bacterium]|nr:DUF1949 domain-containing protein [Clostridia bacterium]